MGSGASCVPGKAQARENVAQRPEDETDITDPGSPTSMSSDPFDDDYEGNYEGAVFDFEAQDSKHKGRHGTLTFDDGSVYQGGIEDDQPCGWGILKLEDGFGYEGEWSKGKKHGDGTYRYLNGDVYDGEWFHDERNGKGTFTTAHPGGVYECYWKDDPSYL